MGGSWTLSIEVVWYVCFALAFVFGLHRKPMLLALATSAFFVFIACLSIIFHTRLPLGRLGMLGACLVGYYFYKSFNKQIEKKAFRTCIATLLTSIFLLLWTSFSYYQAEGTTFQCVLISWMTGFMLFLVPFMNREKRFFRLPAFMMLGRYSYSIYLIHPLAIFCCLYFLQDPAIQLFCMIALSLAVSVVTFNLVEAPGIWAGKAIDRFFSSRKASRYRENMT